MIDPPEIVDAVAVRTAVVRLVASRAEIGKVMGPGIEELMTTVASQGVALAGPWFTHHFRIDPDRFDFEIGVPVAAPVTAAGRVTPGELPATRVARTVYRGGYDGLAAAWSELDAWIAARGLTRAADLWEVYAAGPESGAEPALWRTELNRPLAS